MKPVYQTTFGEGTGNCFQAAVASLFELPLIDVPNFAVDLGSDWFDVFRDYCSKKFGVVPIYVTHPFPLDLRGWYLGVVKSPRGILHSVVCKDGEVLHDPFPGVDKNIKYEYEGYTLFMILDPKLLGKCVFLLQECSR